MDIAIRQVGPESLPRYAEVPIRFPVESVLSVEQVEGGLGGLAMREQKLARPYVKDYDRHEPEGPTRWAKKWDLRHWGLFMAFDAGEPVGGAAAVFDTPGVNMLDGRTDLAVLWDLRVHPDYRRRGIGRELFQRVVRWARSSKCAQLKIETQNVNVPACRFYAAQGCHLGAVVRYAYREPQLRDEVMLLWYLDL
jgi:GNAT superfamily N-acetyltransferase